jgi:peptide chain release factor 1
MSKGPLIARLAQLAGRAAELETMLADPKIISDHTAYQKHAKEYAFASRAAAKHRHWESLERRWVEAEAIINDESDKELVEMAEAERKELGPERTELEQEITDLLISDDEDARRDVIIEIRAGTGGDEAGLFAADLFRMYEKYAEGQGWKTTLVSSHPTELGGFKEIIFDVKGGEVYSHLRAESGGHRVQRVPVTETSGRIHTSAVTVAVLPEAEDVDITIRDEDIRIDRFCSSGPGGQSVNTTYSAIRVTHLPTNLVVSCQDEKSQHKNLAKAMRVLRSRLYERVLEEKKQKRDKARKSQIGSGDRSMRVRTYNFPQNRVTDHRLNQNYSLEQIIAGGMDKLIRDLLEMQKEQQLIELAEKMTQDE